MLAILIKSFRSYRQNNFKNEEQSETRVFLPSFEDRPYCYNSHEAHEFAFALIGAIADGIRKSEELVNTLEKHGYIID